MVPGWGRCKVLIKSPSANTPQALFVKSFSALSVNSQQGQRQYVRPGESSSLGKFRNFKFEDAICSFALAS